jgi:hypothetical protein
MRTVQRNRRSGSPRGTEYNEWAEGRPAGDPPYGRQLTKSCYMIDHNMHACHCDRYETAAEKGRRREVAARKEDLRAQNSTEGEWTGLRPSTIARSLRIEGTAPQP